MRLLLEAAVRHKGLGPYHADSIRTWPPNVITKAFVFFKIETSAAYRVCAVGSADLVITLYKSLTIVSFIIVGNARYRGPCRTPD